MTDYADSRVIVWGYLDGDLQLGMLEDFEYLAEAARTTQRLLDDPTWNDLIEVYGEPGVRDEFEVFLSNAWQDQLGDEDQHAEMPDDWYPDEVPDLSGDWLTDRPRINDPGYLNLPQQIMELGNREGHMIAGDSISWDRSALPELKRLARGLGYEFVERQDLIVRVE